MHVTVQYPNAAAEKQILQLARNEAAAVTVKQPRAVTQEELFAMRKQVLSLHMAPAVEDYIVNLTVASRWPGDYSEDLAKWIEFGVSPRGTIALDRCARAHAWLNGKDFVSPDDVQAILPDVFRHRLLLSFEAEASGIDANRVIRELIAKVPVA